MKRRCFLHAAGVTLAGAALGPRYLLRPARASGGKTLVVVFMRGAADGLNLVVPYSEDRYYSLRSTIAVPRPGAEGGAVDLDGRFGLHPSAAPMKSLWTEGTLAVVEACGSPDPSRSHFSAMAYMESGTPGSVSDGWINRYLQSLPGDGAFRATFLGGALPHSMLGTAPTLALSSLRSLQMGKGERGALRFDAIAKMYEVREDEIGQAGRESIEAIKAGKSLDPDRYVPANGAEYPGSSFGQNLKQIAQMIKADIGVEIAETDIEGWDTHANQGGSTGQMATLVSDFARALEAFATDLGDGLASIVLVTMSEFGRTAAQNGSGGTDHGHAGLMFILGGPVAGGQVFGKWPGLGGADLYDGRDLAVTTDFRMILSEVVDKHMGNTSTTRVFPGFPYDPQKTLGVIRSS